MVYVPFIISSILFGAHFLRWGATGLTILAVLFPFVLFVRHRIIWYVAQVYLMLAALMWLNTAVSIAMIRQSQSEAWIRMAVILGAVVLFNLWALLLLRAENVRKRYPAIPDQKNEGSTPV